MKRSTTLNNRFLIIIYLYHKEIYSFFYRLGKDRIVGLYRTYNKKQGIMI
jgi:hypothetical protein